MEASTAISRILDELGVRADGLSSERKGTEYSIQFTVHLDSARNRELMRRLLELDGIDYIHASEEPRG